ncbi:MAG: UbiA family prenyltransferase [bacterium]
MASPAAPVTETTLFDPGRWVTWFGIHWLLAWLSWSSALAAVHLVNLVTDRESDAHNGKNLFWHQRLSARCLGWLAGSATLLSLGLGVTQGLPLTLAVVVTLVLGAAYSLPPLRLAGRWGWDLAANCLGYGVLAPWVGLAMVTRGWPRITDLAPTITWLVPLVGTAFLWTTVLDRQGDRATGKISWSVRWGEMATLRAAVVSSSLCLVAVSGWFLKTSRATPTAAAVESVLPWGAAAGLLLLAALFLAVVSSGRRQLVIGATVLAVVAAGAPALVRWPGVGLGLLVWCVLAYGCLYLARVRSG